MQNLKLVQDSLLENDEFIQKIRKKIIRKEQKNNNLGLLIQEVKQILGQLIKWQLQVQLKQIIEDNNKILRQIKSNMSKPSFNIPSHQILQDISFNQVHRVMEEERRKGVIPTQQITDANLQKSISAFVQLKVQNIQEKVIQIDKRLKNMEDKYQTNLKSLWNVLSITESAIFEHLKEHKNLQHKQKQNILGKSQISTDKSFFKNFFGGK